MARSNKYTSLNFNEIYEKKFTSNNSNTYSSSSSTTSITNNNVNNTNKTIISNSRIKGNMLVLTRPTPKPKPVQIPQKQYKQEEFSPDQARPEPDSISLRPQGRTGPSPGLISSPLASPGGSVSPSTSPFKTDKFVPPHLRPGFAGREEKPGPEFLKGGRPGGNRVVLGRAQMGSSPNRYGDDRRPKSGGGYERMRRDVDGGEAETIDFINRARSSGARPSSSG